MTNVVVNKPRKGPKVFTIVMSMADLVWMGVGAALALTVFFVFGLLVGRGYFPADEGMQAGANPQADQAQLHAQGETTEEPEVLKPEELSYPDKLSPSSKPKPKPEPDQTGEQAPGEQASGTDEPVADQATADAMTGDQTGEQAEAETAEQPAEQDEPDPNEPQFDYIYQVAAFKEQSMAQDLADRLAGQGLVSEVKTGENKGVTWHRVRVLFTGTPPQTRELRDSVFEITKVKPVLVSKKPLE